MRALGGRISPSLVISVIALFVALGGASYAVVSVPKNSVGTKQLKKKAVGTKQLKKKAVGTGQLKGSAVTGAKLGNDSVDSSKVKNGSLLLEDFQAGQVKPDIYIGAREPSPPFSIPASPSFGTVVETNTEVPAGNYLLFGRANVVAGAVESSVTCVLGGGGDADTAQSITVLANKSLALSMVGPYTSTETGKVSLFCFRSGGTAQVYQASINAVPVNSIIGLP